MVPASDYASDAAGRVGGAGAGGELQDAYNAAAGAGMVRPVQGTPAAQELVGANAARSVGGAPAAFCEAASECAQHPDVASFNAALWASVGGPAAAFAELGA